jgi:hypothetical protein
MFVTPKQAAAIEPRAYSVPHFLAAYGLGRTKLYAEIKAKHLKVVKLGRRTFIDADEARRWWASLSSQEVSP